MPWGPYGEVKDLKRIVYEAMKTTLKDEVINPCGLDQEC